MKVMIGVFRWRQTSIRRRVCASIASWRPFMPPGMMTSVNMRSMGSGLSMIASASAALLAANVA